MGSVPERRPDGAEGRGVRQPRQDLRDPDHRHGPRRRRAPATSCWSRRSAPATSSACARPRTRRSSDWVKLAVTRARATGDPAVFWLDESRAHDAQPDREGQARTCPSTTPRACDIEIMSPGRRDRVLPGAHPPRRGHHLGHRQRAARLPDRPVPDPGAGHQRQDAVGRPADERRRPVRDRRRRLRARSTSSSWSRRTTCAGTAWASSSRWRSASSTSRRPRATRAPRSSPTPSTAPPATFLNENKSPSRQRRRHRQPRQPLLPGAVLGAGAGRADRRRRSSPRRSRRSPRRWPSRSRPSSTS